MKRVALASLAIFVAATAVAVLLIQNPEPNPVVRQGKPIVDWALDFNSPSPIVRDRASEVLRSAGAEAVEPLVRLLRTPDPVLAQPVKFIGWHAPLKVRGFLFGLIDPYGASAKRAAAAQALRVTGSNAQTAIPALSRGLQDDQTVSWHAALALAQLGQPGIMALTAALSSTGPAQSGFVCYALSTQGQSASNAVPALDSLLARSDPELGEKAASALSAIGRPAMPSLLRALSNPDPRTRAGVVRALARSGPLARDAIPRLIRIANDADPEMRVAVLDALAQIQPTAPAVVAALGAALGDPVRQVRLKALQGLSRSPGTSREAISAIVRTLKDPSPEVRGQAASLLGAMGGSGEIVPALMEALKDPNESVRTQVREVLDKLNQRRS